MLRILSVIQKKAIKLAVVPQINIPPIVGVPSFAACILLKIGVWGLFLICLPILFLNRKLVRIGV